MTPDEFQLAVERAKLNALYEFAYGAGHEINNPLANISARAQTLLRDESQPERQRVLAAIITQTERAHAMIADLMLFAKPPALQRERCELQAWWQRTTPDLREQAMARHIVWQTTLPTERTEIDVDPLQLTVATRELIQNALQLGPELTMLQLTVSKWGESGIRIEVADNGPGLTKEQRGRIFDPFYSGREAGRGLGFGLCKAWRIVTDHGGTIQVESQPGQGCRMVLEIPAPTS